jgi:hypothetical protein
MAIRARNQVKIITASSGGTLQAPAGEGYLVKDVHCVPSSADAFLGFWVDGTSLLGLRVKGYNGNHCRFPYIKTAAIAEAAPLTLLGYLRQAGLRMLGKAGLASNGGLEDYQANHLDIRLPICSDSVLTLQRYAEAGNVVLVYDVYDAADINAEMVNGPRSKIRRYLHYASAPASSANGDLGLTTSLLTTSRMSGISGWPIDLTGVPPGNVFRLLALVGGPNAKGASAANKGYSTFLKLMQRATVLFDVDKNGLPFLGDTSALSATSYVSLGSVIGPLTAENPQPPFILDPALEFGQGETLTISETIANYASGGPGASEADVALVLEHTYA